MNQQLQHILSMIPKKDNGLPDLNDQQIDSLADIIITSLDSTLINKPHPINMDQISEVWGGFTIEGLNLTKDRDIDGCANFNKRMVPDVDRETGEIHKVPIDPDTIVIDRDLMDNPDQSAPYRFNLAHEFFHVGFQSEYYLESAQDHPPLATDFHCSKYIPGQAFPDDVFAEHQANIAAMGFTMPKTVVLNVLAHLPEEFFTEPYKVVSYIASLFDVPAKEALARLKMLKQFTLRFPSSPLTEQDVFAGHEL